MKVTAEKIDNQQVVLEIEVPSAELDKAVAQAVKRIANKVSIPGFRKGKAPRKIIEQHAGLQAILDEAFDIVAPKAFDEALEEQKIEPVVRPNIDVVTLEEGQDLVFKATVTPTPEVTLGEYKGIKVEKKVQEVTDEAVDSQIEQMRNRVAKRTDAPDDATVAEGDLITLDFEGFVDDVAFEGGEGKDYPLTIGSGQFIPGFEDQLIGAKKEENRDVKVTFPEDYQASDLAGKEAVFKCTVHTIKHKELPELDDEFAKKVSNFQTFDELKADVRKNLEDGAEKQAEIDKRTEAIEQAAENAQMEIPEVMVDTRVNAMIREMAMRLSQQGMTMDRYLEYIGSDMAKLREEYREQAQKNVRTDLMLASVARAEGIKVEAEDLDKEVEAMAHTYGATADEVKKIITKQGRIGDLATQALRRKTAQFIISNIAE